jgi:hypothetical protein
MGNEYVRWLHQWPDGAPPAFRLGRAGDELVAEWVGVGTLRASLDGTCSRFSSSPRAAAPHIEERLREHVAALLRHLQGGITFHASSVARGDTALAFLGESGAGKSTLAAKLCADERMELLADDTTALSLDGGVIRVVPTERHHWLRADIARAMGLDPGEHAKVPREASRAAVAPVRLRAVVALTFGEGEGGGPALRRVRGADAFALLSRALFRFALDVPDALVRELDALSWVAREVPLFELRRAANDVRSLDASPAVVAALLDDSWEEGKAS